MTTPPKIEGAGLSARGVGPLEEDHAKRERIALDVLHDRMPPLGSEVALVFAEFGLYVIEEVPRLTTRVARAKLLAIHGPWVVLVLLSRIKSLDGVRHGRPAAWSAYAFLEPKRDDAADGRFRAMMWCLPADALRAREACARAAIDWQRERGQREVAVAHQADQMLADALENEDML